MIEWLTRLPHRRQLLLVFWILNAVIGLGLLAFALR